MGNKNTKPPIVNRLLSAAFKRLFPEWTEENTEKKIEAPETTIMRHPENKVYKRMGKEYYIVDGENAGTHIFRKLAKLSKENEIIYFYSSPYCNINKLMTAVAMEGNMQHFEPEPVFRDSDEKQTMDQALIAYTGVLLGRSSKENNYYIVSNDKGYQRAIKQWIALGYSVRRLGVENIIEIPASSKNGKKKSKKSLSEKKPKYVKLAEVKELIDDNEEPDKVVNIINGYKNRMDINRGLTKLYKDSKRAGMVYKKIKPLLKSQNKK